MGPEPILQHIRVVLSIILGLSITTLLKGIASLVEHPSRQSLSLLHLGWVIWALFSVVTFWWWEFGLSAVPTWRFESYLFVISYCSLYFLLSSLLFPDDVREYGNYEIYLISRRRWFFGLIALITLMDVIDTEMKGPDHWHALGIGYPLRIGVMLVISGLGATLTRRAHQIALVIVALAYQAAYFALEYVTVTPT